MLVDVGNGFPEVLEMMECGYFRLFELVVWLFIVVLGTTLLFINFNDKEWYFIVETIVTICLLYLYQKDHKYHNY